jgi:calmodulin
VPDLALPCLLLIVIVSLQIMIKEVDEDGNGEISLDEFLHMIGKRIKETSGGNVVSEAFSAFDHDHNEILTPDEIRRVMLTIGEKLSDEEVEALVKGVGCPNGRLTFAKFHELIAG